MALNDTDVEDFEDLSTYLNSEEFKKLYDNTTYQPTGKSWAGNNVDYSGMTLEDFGR